MYCHGCKRELKKIIKNNDIELHICPVCQGIAIKDEDLKKIILLAKNIIKKRSLKAIKVDIMKYSKQKVPLSKCPNCNYNLYTIENKGLILDYCLNCRVFWFDKGELASFLNRYKEGKIIVLESSEYTNDSVIKLIFSMK